MTYVISPIDGALKRSAIPGPNLPPFPAPPTNRPVRWRVNPLLVNLAAFCRLRNHAKDKGRGRIVLPRYLSLEAAVKEVVGLITWTPVGWKRVFAPAALTAASGEIKGRSSSRENV